MPIFSVTLTIFPKLYQDKANLIQDIVKGLEKNFQIDTITLSTGEHRYLLILQTFGPESGITKIMIREGGYELTLELIIFAPEALASRFLSELLKKLKEKATISFFEIKKVG